MTQCPNCQTVLPEPPEPFCPNCGADLAAAGVVGPFATPPAVPAASGRIRRPPGFRRRFRRGAEATARRLPGGQTPWERRDAIGFVNALIETTKQVLPQPAAFFRSMPVTGGLGGPLLYAVIVGYIGLFASTIYNLVFRSVLSSSLPRMGGNSDIERLAGYMQGGAALLMNLILGPVFIVIGAVRERGDLPPRPARCWAAPRAASRPPSAWPRYSQAASIFNIIPGCGGLIGLVYTLVLLVIGLSEAHGISRGKSAAAVLIPFVLICCCCARSARSRPSAWPGRSAA